MARRTRERSDAPRRIAADVPEETAPERWLRRLRFSGFAVVGLVVLALGVVVLAPSLRDLIEQQQQISALERSVATQQQQVTDLQSQLDRWSDPAYIEAQARQRLLFVFPGEYAFLVTNAPAASTSSTAQPVSDQLQTTQTDWVVALLASSYGAGLTTAPAADLAVVGDPAATPAPTDPAAAGGPPGPGSPSATSRP